LGGSRSGRYGRHHRVEHYPQLNVRELAGVGFLHSLVLHNTWHQFEIAARIEMTEIDGEHRITIDIKQPERGIFGCTVWLIRRPMRFGGARSFFKCPFCSRPCEALFIYRGAFRCRICADLKYLSQTRDPLSRQHDAIAKLRGRLASDDEKPKRMRWATYDAILDKMSGRQQRLDSVWLASIPKSLMCRLFPE